MFNGVMDPELIRMAQEQMSRMSPSEFARIQEQMMSNPDLLKMASESMKNMRPEDLRHATEQLKHTNPDEMVKIGEKMANASPEEIAAMRSRIDAQVTYEINGSEILKKQGNEFHSKGMYDEALEKYSRAKKNLKDISSSKARNLLLACSLNMMSCYLKTRQYDECINEGTEVLSYDANNVKALYRRGQAFKELQQLEDAVSDLKKAHEVSPNDGTISDVLRDAKERLSTHSNGGLVIEELVEDEQKELLKNHENSESQSQDSITRQHETRNQTSSNNTTEYFQNLNTNPESIRSFQNFISHANPETLSVLGGGQVEGISPDMIKTATSMIGKMSPEELQRMVQLASSFKGENPYLKKKGSSNSSFESSSIPTDMNPEMLNMASDMVSKMSADERQKMFEMSSSSFRTNGSDSMKIPSLDSNEFKAESGSSSSEAREIFVDDDEVGSNSSSGFLESRNVNNSGFSNPTTDLQDQMRNQMKDPAMKQMFTSMMKNMSPDTMASMSEQFGLKLSKEDAEKAQKAMSSLSPDDLDRMMRWADRMQKGVEVTRKTKNLILGKPGMIFAFLMLILAVVLHWLGYIGK
ncbi:outer envelope protein 61-like [Impatiens glandulifera]|uniref:outer envelope protein 61-like n=1 Tax=Impatiens glandulifera TaxID=253017 RepID=UPI001FB15750|nr:outer envelope protein 61-like [Impatiens glandulifera]